MQARRWVYVLKSVVESSRYYVGSTSDVQGRLEEHNSGICRHTNKHRPWAIHVVIEFPDERRAVAFEEYLKSGSGRAFAKRHFE
ncbi:MAG: excinuclease ABC subunit C [Acidobacteria bacterium RIFCSPLOWO2_02_FULL_67_36]|nr:MAG: excinuclease ABC subunit C [Acidobacteria bacterium RIFCSPLOWO2_02_FULL_67_36]OFW23615.1 MAG: excinuclease ABC subunit C [Acidobacteria bacterium RIFCSPLOWO2_12_FULL_66_21]